MSVIVVSEQGPQGLRGLKGDKGDKGDTGLFANDATPDLKGIGFLGGTNPAAAATVAQLTRATAYRDYMDAIDTPPPPPDTPTITQASGEATALSSPAVYRPAILGTGAQVINWNGQTSPTDPIFRLGPGTYFSSAGGSNDLALYGDIKPGGTAQAARWPISASFITSSNNSVIEVGFFGLNTVGDAPLLEVNGRMVSTLAPYRVPAGSGWKITYTFPLARSRRITLHIPGAAGFTGVRVPSGNTISKPAAGVGPAFAIIGDSYVNGADDGTGGATLLETFAPRLARYMGASTSLLAGIGSTGWVVGDPTSNYASRLAYVLATNPTDLFFYGSINDGATGPGVAAKVTAALALCAAVPRVYVIGPLLSGYATANAAIRAATLDAGRTFIDLGDFMNGSGSVTAKAGNGTNDAYRLADLQHPSFEGHTAIAREIFSRLGYRV